MKINLNVFLVFLENMKNGFDGLFYLLFLYLRKDSFFFFDICFFEVDIRRLRWSNKLNSLDLNVMDIEILYGVVGI